MDRRGANRADHPEPTGVFSTSWRGAGSLFILTEMSHYGDSLRMDEPAGIERRIVHYTGRVQGVGFRFTTCRLAESFAVAGRVKNLPDGRVRVVVEGGGWRTGWLPPGARNRDVGSHSQRAGRSAAGNGRICRISDRILSEPSNCRLRMLAREGCCRQPGYVNSSNGA